MAEACDICTLNPLTGLFEEPWDGPRVRGGRTGLKLLSLKLSDEETAESTSSVLNKPVSHQFLDRLAQQLKDAVRDEDLRGASLVMKNEGAGKTRLPPLGVAT